MRARQQGFTLTELILVIVVMGLLAGIAIPALTDRQGQDDMSVRDEAKTMLNMARKVAMVQRRNVCFMRNGTQLALVYANLPAAGCVWSNTRVVEPGTGSEFVVDVPPAVVLAGAPIAQFTSRGQLQPSNASLNLTVGSAAALTIVGETGLVY